LICYLSRYRDSYVNRVLAPEGEILSFSSPSHMDVVNVENAGAQSTKESIQRKGDSNAACFLRPEVFIGLCQRNLWQSAASWSRPYWIFPIKSPMLGGAYATNRYLHNVSL
jgi:hypothetical protein